MNKREIQRWREGQRTETWREKKKKEWQAPPEHKTEDFLRTSTFPSGDEIL
jgi:hypothetical protein